MLARLSLRVYTRFMNERCHCATLRRAAAFSTEHYDAALAPVGIKVTMFRLLRRIEEADGVSISGLAARVGLDRSTLGRNLRVLEKQGLIRTALGDDQRSRRIFLTEEGRTTLNAAVPLWQAAQDDFARLIGPDALALLAQLADLKTTQSMPAGEN